MIKRVGEGGMKRKCEEGGEVAQVRRRVGRGGMKRSDEECGTLPSRLGGVKRSAEEGGVKMG